MMVHCPICLSLHIIPDSLTLSTSWSVVRDGQYADYSLRTEDGRLIAQVWRNSKYDQDHKLALTDWHWQYTPLDRCCEALPGGNTRSPTAAMQAAVVAFAAHCAEIGIAIVGMPDAVRGDKLKGDKLRVEVVLRAACINHGVTRTELLSPSRASRFARARWSAMLALRNVGGWSFPRIAGALGRRDHVTVMKGIRSAEDHMRVNPDYRDAVARVQQAAEEAKNG